MTEARPLKEGVMHDDLLDLLKTLDLLMVRIDVEEESTLALYIQQARDAVLAALEELE